MARNNPPQPKKPKAQPKARFDKEAESLEKLATNAQSVAAKMKAHSAFGPTNNYVVDLDQKATNLLNADKAVLQAQKDLDEKMGELNKAMGDFHQSVDATVSHVNSVAKGDRNIILGSGLGVVEPHGTRPPTELPPAPTGLVAKAGVRSGEVDLTWDTNQTAYSYVIEQSADPNTGFAIVSVVTKAKVVLTNRPAGQKLWFRVSVVNPVGTGPSCPAVSVSLPA